MLRLFIKACVPIIGLSALTACSSDGSLTGSSLSTSSINTKQAAKPSIDPRCVTLVSKIDGLRKDGLTGRVAKAGEGKSKTVAVYRTSLAKMAELDRTNAEFQQRCATLKPATAALNTTPAIKPAVKKAAVNTAKKKVIKKAAVKAVTAKPVTTKAATSPVKTVAKAAVTDAAKKAATEAAQKAATEAAKKAATEAATKVVTP